jgi:hypothetical protein
MLAAHHRNRLALRSIHRIVSTEHYNLLAFALLGMYRLQITPAGRMSAFLLSQSMPGEFALCLNLVRIWSEFDWLDQCW